MSRQSLTALIKGAMDHLETFIKTYHLSDSDNFTVVIHNPNADNVEDTLLAQSRTTKLSHDIPFLSMARESFDRGENDRISRKHHLLISENENEAEFEWMVPVNLSYNGIYYAKNFSDSEDFLEFVMIYMTDGFSYLYLVDGTIELKANYKITSFGKGQAPTNNREYYQVPITVEVKGYLVGDKLEVIKKIKEFNVNVVTE